MPEKIGRTSENSKPGEEIAQKIRNLFDKYKKPDGSAYTFSEVERLSGGAITSGWLWKLAHGQASRPGLAKLETISTFFGVAADYWTRPLEETASADSEEKREPSNLQQLTLRARDLSDDDIDVLLTVVEALRKKSGNPNG